MVNIYVLVLILLIVVVLARQKASAVYDAIIVRLTRDWYAAVIDCLDPGSSVLDVGIGTATALASQAKLVASKNLQIVGIDYEPAYISAAKKLCASEPLLKDRVHLHCASVYDMHLLNSLKPSQGFDAIYFSGSLTLLPDPVSALKSVATLLKPKGKIHITQTYQRRVPPFLATLKPLLKYITTIDFGQLTTEEQILAIFQAANDTLTLQQHEAIPNSVNTQWQAAYHSILVRRSS